MEKKEKSKVVQKLERKLQRLEEEQKKLSSELRQQSEEVEYFNTIVLAIAGSLDILKTLQLALHTMMDTLAWDSGAVYLMDEKENCLKNKHHHLLPNVLLEKIASFNLEDGIGGFVAKTHEPHLYSISEYPSYLPLKALFKSNDIAYVCFLPLINLDKLVGMMLLTSKKKPVLSSTQFLSSVSRIIGIAITNSFHHQQTKVVADKYENLVASLADVVYEIAPDGMFLSISQGVEELVGHKPKDFHRRTALWLSLVHPDDKKLLLERTTNFNSIKETITIEYRVLPKGKAQYKWVRDVMVPPSEPNSTLTIMHGTLKDISQFKNAIEEVRKSNENTLLG